MNHKQAEIYSFKWVSFPEIYTIFLYGILTRNEVIEDSKENFILFELAFSGKPLLKPLKIKWKLPGHAGSIKTPIVRVIQVLMEELQLIVNIPEPMRFAKTIESIFVNDDGSEIKNVYQSKNKIAPTKNNSKEALLIDDIIKKFSSVNSSVIPR